MTNTGDRVVVVGGGVIGCGAAYELAEDHDVTVLEKGQVASEASALAAGIIGLSTVYDDVPGVAHYAADFFESFDGTGEFSYTRRGSVGPVRPATEATERRMVDRLAESGIPVSFLDPDEVRERYPRFDMTEFAGAVEFEAEPGKGWVDPYTLSTTYEREATARGASVQTETTVTGFVVEDGAVHGVETTDGVVEADHVVVAAGWRTPDLLAEHVAFPVRPYRTQCVVLEPTPELGDEFPMGYVPGEHVYFRPELNGDLLVGGWSFATDDPDGASSQEDEAFRHHVAALLPRVFHEMDDAEFVNGWAGVDAATPDQRPIVDAPAEVENLVVATGFHGRGVMTSPVAAAAVRALVTGTDAPFPLDPFSLDRFESRSRDFEFHSISDH